MKDNRHLLLSKIMKLEKFKLLIRILKSGCFFNHELYFNIT